MIMIIFIKFVKKVFFKLKNVISMKKKHKIDCTCTGLINVDVTPPKVVSLSSDYVLYDAMCFK